MARRERKLTHDQAIFLLALAGGLPAVLATCYWLWQGDYAGDLRVAVLLTVFSCWFGFASAVQQRVVRPLQTMSNLLLALREGDFSFRARGAGARDSLGELLIEINGLGDILQSQRRGQQEATALLTAVIKEIDFAIFAFDAERVLRLVNPAGQALLGRTAEQLLGREADAIGMGALLDGEPVRVFRLEGMPGGHGRWGLRRTAFREEGKPHQLLVLGDLSRALREEQLKAWQRLVRVLGHELNNSLTPIKSIATTLGSALERSPRRPDWEEDMQSGLGVIAARAGSLERFLQGYTQLARLPPPQLAPTELGTLLRQATGLERRLAVEVTPGPPLRLNLDVDQVAQVAINLIKNAVDAALEQKQPQVRVSWRKVGEVAEISIEDNGAGIGDTANLFVPFFTTKANGSGIGLVLSQQIAENHDGSLNLYNRDDRSGCIAILRLPLPISEKAE